MADTATTPSSIDDEELRALEELAMQAEAAGDELTLADIDEILSALEETRSNGLVVSKAPRDATDEVLDLLDGDTGSAEAACIQSAAELLAGTLVTGETRVIHSYRLADVFYERRVAQGKNPNPLQTLHYTQFMLREAAYVCRHSIGGGFYLLHPEERCSPACDEKYLAAVQTAARRVKAPPRPVVRCTNCFGEIFGAVAECEICGAPTP